MSKEGKANKEAIASMGDPHDDLNNLVESEAEAAEREADIEAERQRLNPPAPASDLERFINERTGAAKKELLDLQDRATHLIGTLNDADGRIREHLTNYSRKVDRALQAKTLIGQALDDLEKEFGSD